MLCWVGIDLHVQEDFIGLYPTDFISSGPLASIVKDSLLWLNLCIKIVGANAMMEQVMRGCRTGVAKQIMYTEPPANYLHCYRRVLNLACQDTIHSVKELL